MLFELWTTGAWKTTFLSKRSSKPWANVRATWGGVGAIRFLLRYISNLTVRAETNNGYLWRVSKFRGDQDWCLSPIREIKWSKPMFTLHSIFPPRFLFSLISFMTCAWVFMFSFMKNCDQKTSRQSLLCYSPCVSERYPTNRAIWMVPGARGILL